MGNKISYNVNMKKNIYEKMKSNSFKSTKDLTNCLANNPDYKDQIKIIREILGLTQEQLAKMVDRTPRSIRNIENGEAFPRITTLQKIADALNSELKISIIPKTDIFESFYEKTKQAAKKSVKFNDTSSSFEIQSPSYDRNDFQIGETD